MSRIIKFAKAGGPDVLEFLKTEVPAPGPTEVRIKIKAIGINRAESMWRTDVYIEPVAKSRRVWGMRPQASLTRSAGTSAASR
jgi:NADPH:quinone reductase-like Zn-dependent oxidoreductase